MVMDLRYLVSWVGRAELRAVLFPVRHTLESSEVTRTHEAHSGKYYSTLSGWGQ